MGQVVHGGIVVLLAVVIGPGAVLIFQWLTGRSNEAAGRHRARPLARHARPPDDELANRRKENAMSTQTPDHGETGGPEQVVNVNPVDDDGTAKHPEPVNPETDEETDEQTEDESTDQPDAQR